MTRHQKPLSDEELHARLVSAGLRITKQRMLLLRELDHQRRAMTHAELTERLADLGADRATIYRSLVLMSELGVLIRTQLGDAVWRYEMPNGSHRTHGDHAHFVCNECGGITCLNDDEVTLRGRAAPLGVTEVQVRGRCASCRRLGTRLDRTRY
jgi:Fur family transcriptional regulator, ferric uptake regulator